ncbi:SH3 domain-containing protein [Williamsia herbipolensis]|uniref:SH3 domain-containing protein n=1 Tax=Williamsia herbipolensis TaxID=1603258 RepID=UPI00123789C3|nr:SH3 domain-containing protein [Williamsia herbipolensis]
MNRLRIAVIGIVLTGMAAFGVVTTAAPAAAVGTSVISSNSGGANLREGANAGSRSLGYLRNGTNVQMRCYTDGGSATGNYTSNRWFLVWTTALGATGGYVHSSLVANQTGVPRC